MFYISTEIMNLVRLALYNSEIERLLNDKTNAGDRPWGGVFWMRHQGQVGRPQVPLSRIKE